MGIAHISPSSLEWPTLVLHLGESGGDFLEILGVSVDRITFLGGHGGKVTRDRYGVEVYHALKDLEASPLVRAVGKAEYPYKQTLYMQDGSVLQIADRTSGQAVRPLRYEFNPNNWTSSSMRDSYIMQVLRCLKNVSLSRLDIAVDVLGEDLGKYRITDFKGRKQTIFKDGSGNVETIYIGSRRSPIFIRIYNKAKERTDSGINPEYSLWWRIEAEIKGDLANDYNRADFNPFEGLALHKDFLVDDKGIKLDYDIRTKAMLYYIQQFPNAINEINKNSRSKYKQLLCATTEQSDSFTMIYDDYRGGIHETVETYRNLTETTFKISDGG